MTVLLIIVLIPLCFGFSPATFEARFAALKALFAKKPPAPPAP